MSQQRQKRNFATFVRNNGLSIVLFGLSAAFLVGLAFTGHQQHNQMLSSHQQVEISLSQYITTGTFIEAVFENWESEFLQMGALVVLTIFFYQKGSADSKKLKNKEDFDTHSRLSIIHATSKERRKKALADFWRSNSLSFVLFALFLLSLILHALGGTATFNQEAVLHGEDQVSILQYVTTAQFWYESFQNWQSEFLAVGALLVLSIFLRQRGSPESKPVGESNNATGK